MNGRIGIISSSEKGYFSRRIAESAKSEGIDYVTVNPFNCAIFSDGVFLNGKKLENIETFILRSTPYQEEKDFTHLLARVLEAEGALIVNSPSSVDVSGDKMRSKICFRRAGVQTPPAVSVRKGFELESAVESVGGFPVFLKTYRGTRGIGVVFCPGMETLESVAQTMWAYYANVFIEKYISSGYTVRVLVCEGSILGAVRNSSTGGSAFRSNFSRGGEIGIFEPSGEMERLSIMACQSVGAIFAGVDLIEGPDGWQVLEVNSSPGIEGMEKATGRNIAGRILEILLEKYNRAG